MRDKNIKFTTDEGQTVYNLLQMRTKYLHKQTRILV